jgi:hypothetical protein
MYIKFGSKQVKIHPKMYLLDAVSLVDKGTGVALTEKLAQVFQLTHPFLKRQKLIVVSNSIPF